VETASYAPELVGAAIDAAAVLLDDRLKRSLDVTATTAPLG
jgi:hypothetical protein